jgi:antitoxin component HigA of HigAB toxin-antitoxin module
MKDASDVYKKMVASVPEDIRLEVNLSFRISDRIAELMRIKGLTRKQLADALGKRPCEVTKWLSGQHNFTISTLAMLSSFFGMPIISVE